ncbi:MAG TPA: SbmA/BacA-like family transporter [Candidatus Paceibacterota bacterium]|nr:SbmA/BacA-like family transporter [Candidatus Paceibacterota bacterium]
MFRSYFWSRKWALTAYGFVTLILLTTYAQVMTAVRFAQLMNTATTLLKEGAQTHSSGEFESCVITGLVLWVLFIALAWSLKYCTLRFIIWWRVAYSQQNIDRWHRGVSIERLRYRMQDAVRDATTQMATLFTGGTRAAGNLCMFLPMLTVVNAAIERETGYSKVLLWSVFCWGGLGTIVACTIGWKLMQFEYRNGLNEGDFGTPWEELQKSREGFHRLKRQLTTALETLSKGYRPYHKWAAFLEIWLTFYLMGWTFIPLFGLGWFVFKGVLSLGLMAQMKSALDEINNAISFLPNAVMQLAKLLSDLRLLHDLEHIMAQKEAEYKIALRIAAE